MEKVINDLLELQKEMEEKALNKDASIIMNVFRLDELIKELISTYNREEE